MEASITDQPPTPEQVQEAAEEQQGVDQPSETQPSSPDGTPQTSGSDSPDQSTQLGSGNTESQSELEGPTTDGTSTPPAKVGKQILTEDDLNALKGE